MKIPSKNTKGILTTFFLTSAIPNQPVKNHDELDFEFLGSNDKGYALNTNVFANDFGGREQQFRLWFDPTADFHTYEILWNQKQIVFFVDGRPIRVFKNNEHIGVNYPKNLMHIETSLWNATWAGNVDWSQEPFIANYRGFEIEGCLYDHSNPNKCYSQDYYWNAGTYLQLSPNQQRIYEVLRKKYMSYDYCTKNLKNHPECESNK
ncbi:putative xyloglucan endotransglucosylase/hydrolase protein 1 [Olea europaea var. sylvestris]|nr:putative xyloglucan endotransglucosylase/hydrolase protein 1 [Olea europaea var. sylvestris]